METCRVCGKPLPKMPPSQRMKYCSIQCAGKAKHTLPDVKTCEVCGMEWQPQTRFQAARNKTCGPECNAKRISLVMTGVTRVLPRMAVCLQCGETFRILNGRMWARYCSRSCRGKANADHLTPYSGNMKGRKRADLRFGPDNPAWKGGVTLKRTHGNYQGVRYVRCPAGYLAMARGDGYVMEHRLVMARALGRCLTRAEVVHHIDHNPANNSPDNLQLFPNNRAHKLAEAAASRSGRTSPVS